jgi:hypothetical protein
MGSLALTDAAVWLGGYDWSAQSNHLTLGAEVQDADATTFGSGGYRARKGTLRKLDGELRGLWESAASAAPDPEAFSNLGVRDRVLTASHNGVETVPAYLSRQMHGAYEQFDEIGKLAPFKLKLAGSNPEGLVRGQVQKAKGNVSATGAIGSPVNLSAFSTGLFLYVTVHVFQAGTTITLDVETDSASNFPSPTARATIGPLTAAGGTWMTRVPGTGSGDSWYRLNVTAITGTFQLAAAVAVQ